MPFQSPLPRLRLRLHTETIGYITSGVLRDSVHVTGESSPEGVETGRPAPAPASAPEGAAAKAVRPARLSRALWLWAVAVPAVLFGASAGMLIVRVVASANPARTGPARFASTEGVLAQGNGNAAPGWSVPGLTDPTHAITLRHAPESLGCRPLCLSRRN